MRGVARIIRRQPAKYVKWCDVHLPRGNGIAIVASAFNHGGLFAEKQGGASTCGTASHQALGDLIWHKLDECEFQIHHNYSHQKKTDLPAFKVSKCKTLKEFDHEYARYLVTGANGYNIIFFFQSPDLPNQIRLEASFSKGAEPSILGAQLSGFHRSFLEAEAIARK
ncbi:MAG: hypothetical protein MUO23_07110 [Anaerolineales bacterium]|nr:hypothetical protein [Anaerolineales bacterium]